MSARSVIYELYGLYTPETERLFVYAELPITQNVVFGFWICS